jgi:hypothetical protein
MAGIAPLNPPYLLHHLHGVEDNVGGALLSFGAFRHKSLQLSVEACQK